VNLYLNTVLDWGNIQKLASIKTVFYIGLFIALFPSCLIQLFFAWRVGRLANRWWALGAASVLAAAQVSSSIGGLIAAFKVQENIKSNETRSYTISCFVAETLTNLINTGYLAYFFRTIRTGFQDTDDLLNRLTHGNLSVIASHPYRTLMRTNKRLCKVDWGLRCGLL